MLHQVTDKLVRVYWVHTPPLVRSTNHKGVSNLIPAFGMLVCELEAFFSVIDFGTDARVARPAICHRRAQAEMIAFAVARDLGEVGSEIYLFSLKHHPMYLF